MDDEVIRILIEIKNFAQSYKQVKQMAQAVRDMDASTKSSFNNASKLDQSFRKMAAGFRSVRTPSSGGGSYKNHPHYKAWAAANNAGKTAPPLRVDTINITANVVNVNGGRGGSGGGNGGGGRAPDPNKTQSFRQPPIGRYAPAQRLQRQMMSLRAAIRSGDPQRIFDAQYGAHMLHQRVAQAKNFMNPMSIQARNISNAMAPVRALMTAVGEVGSAFATVGGIVIGAGIAIGVMTKAAMDASIELMKIGLTAGGTQAETSQLSVLGNALGVDMAQLAREFADRISRGGEAGGFAARMGIHDFGTFDTTNKADKILKALQGLDKLNADEAKRSARAMGIEALLPYRELSKQTKENLFVNDPAARSIAIPERTQREMLELSIAAQRVQIAFMNCLVPIIDMAVNTFHVVDALNRFATELNSAAIELAAMAANVNVGVLTIKKSIGGDVSPDEMTAAVAEMIRANAEWLKEQDRAKHPLESALDRNTRSVDRNTDQWATRSGIYGGGERARGAVPSKWSGMNTERYIGEARKLGAFAL